jgi:hypothetical protein
MKAIIVGTTARPRTLRIRRNRGLFVPRTRRYRQAAMGDGDGVMGLSAARGAVP